MKPSHNIVSNALNNLSAIKIPQNSPPSAASANPRGEQIFPEPKVERVTIFLFTEDLKHIDRLLDAAKASGRRKINQSQAIRTLIRSGEFRADTLDRVLAEDGRRKPER